ncbi:hypothetical protein K474DRAFT_1670140 [Panus rudis PR-1116 ss-1]|nr:hypothetical protein K474DRAFT_1670140 [Panus rudis PR-1116 ss-1]
MANTQNPVVPSLHIRELVTLRYDLGSEFPAGTVVQIVDTCMTPKYQTQYEVFEPLPLDAPDSATRNQAANTLYCFVKIHEGVKLSFVHTQTSGIKRNTISSEDVGSVPGRLLSPSDFQPGDMVRLKRPLVDPPIPGRTRFPRKPAALNVSNIPAGTLCFLNGYASQTDDVIRDRAKLPNDPRYALIFAVETPYKNYLAYGRALPAQMFQILPPNDPERRRWQHEVNGFWLGTPKIVSATSAMASEAREYMRQFRPTQVTV